MGHANTINKIWASPNSKSLRWDDLVSYMKSIGSYYETRKGGSRRAFKIPNITEATRQAKPFIILHLHEPHPHSEIKSVYLTQVREALTAAGHRA